MRIRIQVDREIGEYGNEPMGSINGKLEFLTSWANITFWNQAVFNEISFNFSNYIPRTIEELLEWKSSGSGLENRD
jgi:hypothetical protein